MSTPRFAVAIDAGGTTTRAVVVDDTGNCWAEENAGTGNPRAVGVDRAAANITAACLGAARQADGWPEVFVVSAAGILSVGGEFPELHAAFSEAGLEGPLRLEPDLVGNYFSATAEPDGSVLIVGTGTNAARIRGGEVRDLRDGLGWLLGDGGGGFWIGHQVARAAARHLDGRGPETALTEAVLAVTGPGAHRALGRDPRLAALIDWAYSQPPVQLARLAPLALAAARAGDPLAQQICERAAERIVDTVFALPGSSAGPIAVSGGVLRGDSPIRERVLAALGPRALQVDDGVVGAAVLAAGMLGAGLDEELRLRVAASLEAVRG